MGEPRLVPLSAVLAKFEDRLTACRRTWDDTGDPLAVAEGIGWVHCYQQPIPEWLEEAAVRALMQIRTDRQAKRHREAMEHLRRWRMVKDVKALEPKLSWTDAAERAAQILAAEGRFIEPGTIWESYKTVQRDMRARRTGKYWTLKDRRYRHLG